MICRLALPILLSLATLSSGQQLVAVQDLPNAPVAQAGAQPDAPTSARPNTGNGLMPKSSVGNRIPITLKQAEALVIKNNPQITSARLEALAAKQVVREARSSYWPTAVANLTAVDSQENSRITAGGLNNPIIYERAAGGAAISQLLTDFGQTSNRVASAAYSAKAAEQRALATKEQILLATDEAYFNVLQAQAVLRVANETVSNRQIVVDQVDALAKSALKSDLDLSFAQVNLAQAKLLLLDAQNREQSAQASLAALLGYVTPREFDVSDDDSGPNAPPPGDLEELIQQAARMRPELQALDDQYRSAEKLKNAERDMLLPTISSVGAVGGTPVRDFHLAPWYGAIGVNLEIPIFNGFLSLARAKEADLKAQATRQYFIDARNGIAKDVRTSWLNANTAYSRLEVTNQLLKQANLALDLSQTRYKLGLGSIVELSQAQLQQTQAQISQAQAGYEYRLALSVLRYQTGGL